MNIYTIPVGTYGSRFNRGLGRWEPFRATKEAHYRDADLADTTSANQNMAASPLGVSYIFTLPLAARPYSRILVHSLDVRVTEIG